MDLFLGRGSGVGCSCEGMWIGLKTALAPRAARAVGSAPTVRRARNRGVRTGNRRQEMRLTWTMPNGDGQALLRGMRDLARKRPSRREPPAPLGPFPPPAEHGIVRYGPGTDRLRRSAPEQRRTATNEPHWERCRRFFVRFFRLRWALPRDLGARGGHTWGGEGPPDVPGRQSRELGARIYRERRARGRK